MKIKISFYLLILIVVIGPTIYPLEPESVIVKYEYGPENQALMDLFRFQEIDYYKFSFLENSFKDKFFEISYAEYNNGKSSGEKIFTEREAMKSLMKISQNHSSFEIRVISQKITEHTAKFLFIFNNRLGKEISFEILHQDPPYSLRTPIVHQHGRDDGSAVPGDRISVEKKIPILVYSLPYEDPQGNYKYCQLTAENIPPEKWAEHYGVKHYIIFYLEIKNVTILSQ